MSEIKICPFGGMMRTCDGDCACYLSGKCSILVLAESTLPKNTIKEPSPQFDFEAIYKLYPRKSGKSIGINRCKSKIKSQAKYDALKQAVINYASECRNENREDQYIKQFSTFMNVWEDYINLEKNSGSHAGEGLVFS